MSNHPVISCQNLSKCYQEGPEDIQVLSDITFSIAEGKMLAMVGNSGSGKTTLLNLLGGLDVPSDGFVKIDDIAISSASEALRGKIRNQYLGFVYQFHHLLAEFTAIENVAMPLLIRKESPEAARKAATDILTQVGLGKRLQHRPSELSGGERQRVAIARALVTRPKCVLMDEPTGNLDTQTAHAIQQLIHKLNQESNIAFIVVTHDMSFASCMHDIYRLEQGRLSRIDDSPTEKS